MADYVIGVDVGTGSVRAALFDRYGTRLALAEAAIRMNRPRPDHVEQSSTDIWSGVVTCVRSVVERSGVAPSAIRALGFDATCSLVALDRSGAPVSVSVEGDPDWNVIVWMDHRAIGEAEAINRGDHEVLAFVGGTISPEMEIPKIRWLKTHLPEQYAKVGLFLDLADFLTWRATGSTVRSACTTVCKWTYLNHEQRWSRPFFEAIGLADLLDGGVIGERIADPATPLGPLSAAAAAELGLGPEVVVGVGLIDAHAGGVGVLGDAPEETLAIIAGTSACHMASSRERHFVPGVWGPYWGAMVPGHWLSEGGQSAAGALVDHVIRDSAAHPALVEEMRRSGNGAYGVLNAVVARLEQETPFPTARLHLVGDHLGNRSPLADPTRTGMACGLTLDETLEGLAVRYLAALQAVAYGTRHILETLNAAGHGIRRIRLCGGGAKNPLWVREFADVTGVAIEIVSESEAMLLGSAMLAATAAGLYGSLGEAMVGMSGEASVTAPRAGVAAFHDAKYAVFRRMQQDQLDYRALMAAV